MGLTPNAKWSEVGVTFLIGPLLVTILEVPAHGFPAYVKRALRFAIVEEDPMLDMYEQERVAGHCVIVVQVPGRSIAEDVAEILTEHDAHRIKYFSQWQITDLEPMTPEYAPVASERFETVSAPPTIGHIRDADLLQGLSDTELEKVAALGRIVSVPQGTMLARQGDAGNTVYIIIDGHVELTTDSPQGELTVRIAG